MANELLSALIAVAGRLNELATEDERLRAGLRSLGQSLLRLTDEKSGAAASGEIVAALAGSGAVAEAPAAPAPAVAKISKLPPIRTVDMPPIMAPVSPPLVRDEEPASESPARPAPAIVWPERSRPSYTVTDEDLPLIETRCRMKSEGARWAALRRRRLTEGADFRAEIDPADKDIIARAKMIPDCFLWMNHPSGPNPTDLSLFDDCGGCFEALAEAAAMLKDLRAEMPSESEIFQQALDLAAEAQSAVRASIVRMEGPTDGDQLRMYNWLKAAANEHHIFIRRYMRADDPADPKNWRDIMARIETHLARVQDSRKRSKQRFKRISKLRYLIGQLPAVDDARRDDHWREVAECVEELSADGVPPSSLEIREVLLPVMDLIPERDDYPASFQIALREIGKFRAERADEEAGDEVVEQDSPEVQEVARLLDGKAVLLIGGIRRPHAHRSLEETFRLKELVWPETREHMSLDAFIPIVARSDVALVLLAIRWSSHSYGEVKEFCDHYGKPLVRLPAGYSANQVASQILSQCSGKLAEV